MDQKALEQSNSKNGKAVEQIVKIQNNNKFMLVKDDIYKQKRDKNCHV